MIETRELTKRFDEFVAVDGVSFRVDAGQTLALIGPSGCGKTTTLKMINRLIAPSSGEVRVDGQNVLEQPLEAMRRRMGYVIQNIGLFPHYTVAENIAIVPRLLKWEEERIQKRVNTLLEQLGLPEAQLAGKYPHQLSGGQQQRVGIARALAAEPPIILMDEPFGALDPLTRQQARRDFKEIEELKTKTVIMVTHDIEEAFEMGDLLCLLNQGKVQQLGKPEELLLQPANDFVRSFISEKAAQLELRATTLKDVFGELLLAKAPSEEALSLPAGTPVLRALYELAKSKHRFGSTRLQSEERWFTLDDLFQRFQQTLRSWNN